MAIYTTSDRDAVKDAIVLAAVEGIASVTIAGQQVTGRTLDELRRLLEVIQADLASERPGFGLRFQKIRPVYE